MTTDEAVALIGRHGILRSFDPPRLEEGLFVLIGFIVDPGDAGRVTNLFVTPVRYDAPASREYQCRTVLPEHFGPTPPAAAAFCDPRRN